MKSIVNINVRKAFLLLFILVATVISGMAQGVPGIHVYPKKGQSREQQSQDEQHCYSWAQEEMSANPTPQEAPRRHKPLKRTAAGAGVGALIGGGEGAAIGAGLGAISGIRSKRRDVQESEATISSDFQRAYVSCLKSKEYSVE